MYSCPESFPLSGICHTGTDKSSFFSGRCPYHSGDKSQGLCRSPKGLTFTFGSVERAAAYPRYDREIQLLQRPLCLSLRRQKSRSPQEPGGFNLYFWLCWTCSTLSPVRQGNPAFYFDLPGLSCIPGTDNYLDPPPLCSITLWRVYINHRNINYLFPPDFRGR